jgi:hypothetical protein
MTRIFPADGDTATTAIPQTVSAADPIVDLGSATDPP